MTPQNGEHQRIARLFDIESQVEGTLEGSDVYLIKMDNGLDAFTYLQPNGMWFVRAIDFEEDVPNEGETKEEAYRQTSSLN